MQNRNSLRLAIPALLLALLTPTLRAKDTNTAPVTIDLPTLDHDRVLAAADKYLADKPDTITAHPVPADLLPPGATLHDFYSEADYCWPNPANPTGPYITRDGFSNPDMFMDHRRAMWRFDIEVPALTAAYLLTHDKKYSDAAIPHLEAWFVNPDTRMNPSLEHAQVERRKSTGTAYGLIDTLHLVEVARSVVLLRKEHVLSVVDDAAITSWFADYMHWLTTAPNGIKEGNGTNNHATAYWLQMAAFSQVTGDDAVMAECRTRFKDKLLPQMAGTGGFPRELARTKPYGYSLFQLDLMMMLAHIASTPNDNLFTYTLPNGRNLRLAAEFMYPYVKDKTTWPKKPDVMIYDLWPVRSPAFLYAGLAFNDPRYLDLWKSLNPSPTNEEVLRNLPIRQPLLWQ